MVIDEIERRIEHWTTRIRLHGLQRVTPIAMARALKSGNVFDGVEPGRGTVIEPNRDHVEKQPSGYFGAGTTRAPVGDKPSRDVGLARESM